MRVEVCHDSSVWDEFASSQSSHLYYQWRWREVIEAVFGHEHQYLAAVDSNGKTAGILPLVKMESRLFGRSAMSLPFVSYGGVLTTSDDARAALVDECQRYANEENLSNVLLRESLQFTMPSWSCEQHKVIMRLDLPRDPEDLWKAIGSKRRAQVKRPGKEGAFAKTGHHELLDDFYRVFARNMRDLGTPVQSKVFFRGILDAFPDETHLVVTYLNDSPVAAAFLIRHGDEMEIPWASSLREANRFGVNMLLYWEVLKLSVERGAARFDFGRSSKDSNTLRFKRQWGAEPEQLYWYSWTPGGEEAPSLSPENSKFAAAIAVWQKLPVPVANLIGPRVVKYLP